MNTIKNNGIAFRKSILIPIALLAGILLSSFDLNDVEYGGRYVDLLNAKFHDTDFFIKFHVHDNIVSNTNRYGYRPLVRVSKTRVQIAE